MRHFTSFELTMTTKKLDTWVWVLIYGGMLGLGLGWFMQPRSPALGWVIITAGGVAASIGVLLVVVRSRMGP
jgi:hypothetical protein